MKLGLSVYGKNKETKASENKVRTFGHRKCRNRGYYTIEELENLYFSLGIARVSEAGRIR
jgi:hypothetical protein